MGSTPWWTDFLTWAKKTIIRIFSHVPRLTTPHANRMRRLLQSHRLSSSALPSCLCSFSGCEEPLELKEPANDLWNALEAKAATGVNFPKFRLKTTKTVMRPDSTERGVQLSLNVSAKVFPLSFLDVYCLTYCSKSFIWRLMCLISSIFGLLSVMLLLVILEDAFLSPFPLCRWGRSAG